MPVDDLIELANCRGLLVATSCCIAPLQRGGQLGQELRLHVVGKVQARAAVILRIHFLRHSWLNRDHQKQREANHPLVEGVARTRERWRGRRESASVCGFTGTAWACSAFTRIGDLHHTRRIDAVAAQPDRGLTRGALCAHGGTADPPFAISCFGRLWRGSCSARCHNQHGIGSESLLREARLRCVRSAETNGLDFAILLMRSSYQIADDLNFMPMDVFQKDMFLLRQNEWDSYKDKVAVKQGDLADPNYFDFMSFVQYATIANGMRNGKMVFNELIDANGTSIFVSRAEADPPAPLDNAALPAAHAERVGERILEWIDEKFPRIAPKVPKERITEAALLEGVEQLAAIFQIEEYMLASTVVPLTGGGISWTLVAPATLWSSQVLAVRGDTPVNDFAAKAALAYLRRCGVPATCASRVDKSTQVTHEFRWPSRFVA